MQKLITREIVTPSHSFYYGGCAYQITKAQKAKISELKLLHAQVCRSKKSGRSFTKGAIGDREIGDEFRQMVFIDVIRHHEGRALALVEFENLMMQAALRFGLDAGI